MKIANNVDEEWLEAIKHRTLGFTHKTPREMIEHLESIGAELDDMDITELSTKLHEPWDQIKNPATWFARGDKYEKQLEKAGIKTAPELRLALAKAAFRRAGEYNEAIARFDAKNPNQQTVAVFKTHMTKEFSTHAKQNKSSAKSVQFRIANNVQEIQDTQEQVLTPEDQALIELIAAMQGSKTDDTTIKEFMKTTTETLKALTEKINKSGGNQAGGGQTGGNRNGRRNNRNRNGAKCKHCNRAHFHIVKEEDCWELEENKDKRPTWFVPRGPSGGNK